MTYNVEAILMTQNFVTIVIAVRHIMIETLKSNEDMTAMSIIRCRMVFSDIKL